MKEAVESYPVIKKADKKLIKSKVRSWLFQRLGLDYEKIVVDGSFLIPDRVANELSLYVNDPLILNDISGR